ncbi:MAG: hypothetical protein WD646_09630 [Actinomycetota bacterium]
MNPRRTALLGALAFVFVAPGAGAQVQDLAPDLLKVTRRAEPVVLTGLNIPSWSRLPAVGAPSTWPQGATDDVRDAHLGTLVVPPDVRAGVVPSDIVAFRWDGSDFVEIRVQVDERFPYFFANAKSDFGIYSAVDEELTYAWDVESWKKTAGECRASYPPGMSAMPDPVPGLDNDDEIVFMASDAGAQAPQDASDPLLASDRREVNLVDPLAPTVRRYVYLFLRNGGSSFDSSNGYVRYQRDSDADEWIDRYSFPRSSPEALGTSNTGYGPNLTGAVCRTAEGDGYPKVEDGIPRASEDRFPRDGVTVRTSKYEWRASGRWMVRGMRVVRAGHPGSFGPDLVDRWKGRGYQQSPDSGISLIGFEDEQVNWEANSALVGERAGPVRAIREIWGADSGTNVTKTETFYRNAVAYRYHLRVHPIPPDGIYEEWDHNAGVVTKYFNTFKTEGVDVDGKPDDIGEINEIAGVPAFFDIQDPTFAPVPLFTWQQVSGRGDAGSLVYIVHPKSATSFLNPLVGSYYRDDKCFDDGTGDDPVPRPWPGEASTDERVRAGYEQSAGKPYEEIACESKQGAWGAVGVHFLLTGDTDNAFQSKPLTELDALEWQFAVPTSHPRPAGEPFANSIRLPLIPLVTEN